MDFSTALEEIKRGSVVSRYSWRNKNVSMELGNFAIDNKKDEKRDISYSFFEIGDYGTLTKSPSFTTTVQNVPSALPLNLIMPIFSQILPQ